MPGPDDANSPNALGEECEIFARRSWWQTLLVGVVCGGVMGLLPGHVERDPGRRSLRLACPGLYYVAPLGLKKTDRGGSAMHGRWNSETR